MNNLHIRYYDRLQGELVKLEIPADTFAITIPAGSEENQPEIEVNVNTDAVLVDGPQHRLGGLTFTDLLADAHAAGEDKD